MSEWDLASDGLHLKYAGYSQFAADIQRSLSRFNDGRSTERVTFSMMPPLTREEKKKKGKTSKLCKLSENDNDRPRQERIHRKPHISSRKRKQTRHAYKVFWRRWLFTVGMEAAFPCDRHCNCPSPSRTHQLECPCCEGRRIQDQRSSTTVSLCAGEESGKEKEEKEKEDKETTQKTQEKTGKHYFNLYIIPYSFQ